MEVIKSQSNRWIKLAKSLKHRKHREREQLFLAEGLKFLDCGHKPHALLMREDVQLPERFREKLKSLGQCVLTVSPSIFAQMTSQEHSQGLLFLFRIPKPEEIASDRIITLDGIQDPGNMGTIIRTADAAGFRDVLLSERTVDIYNEKSVRATMGSILHLSFHRMKTEEILNYLQKQRYKIFATSLDRDSLPYDSMRLSDKNAWIFGSEGKGISEKFLEKADEKLHIPLYGKAESLNVATACGIILYKIRELENRR
ncbi:MAG: RNA methyltransferase [Fusobacteriaceae bacterium]|nr:RNA methyltransferase [Fusobacteriaceae bacterium]